MYKSSYHFKRVSVDRRRRTIKCVADLRDNVEEGNEPDNDEEITVTVALESTTGPKMPCRGIGLSPRFRFPVNTTGKPGHRMLTAPRWDSSLGHWDLPLHGQRA